ncbi:MAG: winged helix-turn-helix domain-containing protein [Pirellulales bacterium]|nr:winged helix-turn-helix domain-containing protein [Pirellulales bacterium]
MAAVSDTTAVEKIGKIAGEVWHLLDTKGPKKVTQLVKEIDAPRDQVMQALGWLAREEKIVIEEQSRSRVVSLVE